MRWPFGTDETKNSSLEFRALWHPDSATRRRAVVELGKGHERALVGLLLLHAGRPVSTDRICDALWNELLAADRSRDGAQLHRAGARQRLGDGLITTLPTGYQLEVNADLIHLVRFEQLAKEGTRAFETGSPSRPHWIVSRRGARTLARIAAAGA